MRIFLPIFRMNFPEIVDLALPAEGVFHNLVFVSIRKQYPWQAYKVMHGLWGMGQMMFSEYSWSWTTTATCTIPATCSSGFARIRIRSETAPSSRTPPSSRSRTDDRLHGLAHGFRCHAEAAERRVHPRVAGTAHYAGSSEEQGRFAAKPAAPLLRVQCGLIR